MKVLEAPKKNLGNLTFTSNLSDAADADDDGYLGGFIIEDNG